MLGTRADHLWWRIFAPRRPVRSKHRTKTHTMAKLTPRDQDYSKWYNEIVVEADLAQHSDVKGLSLIHI